MHSPFTALNEDLMRADRKAERMARAAWILAMLALAMTVVALDYARDLHQALQVPFPIAGVE